MTGQVALASPLRLVTLTPHATEMVFAAGAGQHIVATVNSSNYPRQALSLPKIGDGITTSLEEIIRWQPDWVIGWPSPLMQQLKAIGINTWVSDPKSLHEIGDEVVSMGKAFGSAHVAKAWREGFDKGLAKLQSVDPTNRYTKVVVLTGSDAQYAIGSQALINSTLQRCHAVNVFANAPTLAPLVSTESLIAVEPDVIISGEPVLNQAIPGTKVHIVNADWLYRPGPRFAQAANRICDIIFQTRQASR